MNDGNHSGIVSVQSTVATLTAEYMLHVFPRYAENTKKQIRIELQRFALFVGQREINGKILHEFMAFRFAKTSKAWTLNGTVQWVNAFLVWCEEMGYLTKKYSSILRPVKVPKTPPLRFSHQQFEAVKQAAKGTCWHYAVCMAYRTGARMSDVCLLKWENVDMDTLIIRYVPFKSRKTGRYATCPFQAGGDLHDALLELAQARSKTPFRNELVCPELAMRYPVDGYCGIDGKGMIMDFHKIRVKAGVPRLTFHKLRNSFMSRIVDGGVSFPIASQLTGLASVQTFLAYAKPDAAVLRTAIETVDSKDNPPQEPGAIISMPAA